MILIFGLLTMFLGQTAIADSFVKVNTEKQHLEFTLTDAFPKLVFYRNKELMGRPAIELNEQGLIVQGEMVCRWPDGGFKLQKEKKHSVSGMVLGFSNTQPRSKGFKYNKCPAGLPVISTLSEAGNGTEVLYVEVEKMTGDLLEARLHGNPVYLSLKSVPAKYESIPANTLSNVGD